MGLSKRMQEEYENAAREMLKIMNKVDDWTSLGNAVHRIAQFFLPEDDELLIEANDKATHFETKAEPDDLLPLLTVADEAVFRRLNAAAPALESRDPAVKSMAFTIRGLGQLKDNISDEDGQQLKQQLSILRKFCVVLAMEHIRNDSDTSSESENDEDDERSGTFLSRAGTIRLDELAEHPSRTVSPVGLTRSTTLLLDS